MATRITEAQSLPQLLLDSLQRPVELADGSRVGRLKITHIPDELEAKTQPAKRPRAPLPQAS